MIEHYFNKWFQEDPVNYKIRLLPAFMLLMALSFVLYARSFAGAWNMDDFVVIVDNPDIRSFGNFLEDNYAGRPLRELTFMLDYQFFGLDPAGYRLQNIFWHGLNAWLLWSLALRLRLPLFGAWAAALLFVCHPVMVEVVANTSHRKDSLALAFALLSIHAYLVSFSKEQKRYWYLLGAVVAWFVACQAKQNALVVPVLWMAAERLMVPYDRRFLLRYPRWLTCVGIGGFAAATVWFFRLGGLEHLRELTHGALGKQNLFDGWTLVGYYQAVLKSWTFMVGKLLWPLQLGMEYTFSLPQSWLDPWVLVGLSFVPTGLVLLFILRRAPAACFALFWLMVFWLPTANLWPLSYLAADRYMYAPWAGGALLLAAGLEWLRSRFRLQAAMVVLVLLLFGYGSLSWLQINTWHSEETLWLQAYRVSPTSAYALNNLGNMALARGDQEVAMNFYQESFKNNPYNPTSNYNLGFLYLRKGEVKAARRHLNSFMGSADSREFAVQREIVEQILSGVNAFK